MNDDPGHESNAPALTDEGETINRVLAAQARSHGPAELWMTTVGGAMNAVLLWSQFPGLHWLASGFTAVAAYGVWGLLDHTMSVLQEKNNHSAAELRLLGVGARLIGVGGWAAAMFAVVSLLTALVGGLSLPGR